MKKSSRCINAAFLILGVLCWIYYLGMGLAVRFGQSLLFLWPIIGTVCIARYLLWRQAWKHGKKAPIAARLLLLIRILLAVCLAVFLVGEGLICSAAFHTPAQGLDAIIVLGARINPDGPSGSLQERIDTAATYLKANPDTICVCSGGQGNDEPMSEGQCIYEHLAAAGIEEDRLILEDRSTRTVENLEYSLTLISGTGREIRTVGIVTNDFHIYRALCTAHKLGGYSYEGVSARSSAFGFIHYAVREFIATAAGLFQGELILL